MIQILNLKSDFSRFKSRIKFAFCEKELQNNQQEFRKEKVINKKSDKLYVKWKGHDISFNSWIDKKDII